MKTCPQCGESFEPTLKFCPRDGQVLEDAPQDLVGQVLDAQYEIESFVARGGMGAIFRARHILLGDRVAIKVLRPEFRANPEWLRRFQREGQAARRFRHPNAITVYDLRTSSEGLVYMVMEFVAGRSLDKELQARGRFTPAEAFEALEPIGRVLEEAHEQGVVHRDLKPENVMIDREPDGELCVKLLDLGIAKLREIADAAVGDNGAPLTVAGQILGTPYYMSPEQWGEPQRDGHADIDGRADIYSLAVMFYELVAGVRPFDGKTLVELRHAHAVVKPPRLDGAAPGSPAEFARAIERGMAKDRGDRQPTAAAFIAELRAALDLPELALPPPRAAAPTADGDEPTETPEAARAAADTAGEGEFLETVDTILRVTQEEPPPAASVEHAPTKPLPAPPSPAAASAQGNVAPPARGNGQQPRVEVGPSHVAPSGAPPNAAPPHVTSQNVAATSVAPSNAAPVSAASQSSPAPQPAPVSQSAQARQYAQPSPSLAAAASGAKSSRAPLVVLGGLILLFVCASIVGAGWFLWSRWQASRSAMMGAPPASAPGVKTAPVADAPARVEALSYWIEAFEGADAPSGERVARAGAISLASGQQFRFHFSPGARGYLYVVGPGRGNAPTTFLTAQPTVGLLKTNQAAQGSDFAFPYGAGQVLELDKNPGTEEYTVIYSETPLLAPAFLAARAGHELSPAELKELDDLRARAQTTATSLDVKEKGAGAEAVAVSVPDKDAARLVVFEIRIEHQ
ncbi:MAG: protein kinase domain-containing protein [Pyrinomonadaceae bacterium]